MGRKKVFEELLARSTPGDQVIVVPEATDNMNWVKPAAARKGWNVVEPQWGEIDTDTVVLVKSGRGFVEKIEVNTADLGNECAGSKNGKNFGLVRLDEKTALLSAHLSSGDKKIGQRKQELLCARQVVKTVLTEAHYHEKYQTQNLQNIIFAGDLNTNILEEKAEQDAKAGEEAKRAYDWFEFKKPQTFTNAKKEHQHISTSRKQRIGLVSQIDKIDEPVNKKIDWVGYVKLDVLRNGKNEGDGKVNLAEETTNAKFVGFGPAGPKQTEPAPEPPPSQVSFRNKVSEAVSEAVSRAASWSASWLRGKQASAEGDEEEKAGNIPALPNSEWPFDHALVQMEVKIP